jgi:hypothetical protein
LRRTEEGRKRGGEGQEGIGGDEPGDGVRKRVLVEAMGDDFSGGTDREFLGKIETLKPDLLEDGANKPGRKFNWGLRETAMRVWFLGNAGKQTRFQADAGVVERRKVDIFIFYSTFWTI